jgi:hypothetical protein
MTVWHAYVAPPARTSMDGMPTYAGPRRALAKVEFSQVRWHQ